MTIYKIYTQNESHLLRKSQTNRLHCGVHYGETLGLNQLCLEPNIFNKLYWTYIARLFNFVANFLLS